MRKKAEDGAPVNEDFLDLLRALYAADARFRVVGAYAVSVHAEPRTTGDLDIWVESTSDNALRVHRTLQSFALVAPIHDGKTRDDRDGRLDPRDAPRPEQERSDDRDDGDQRTS